MALNDSLLKSVTIALPLAGAALAPDEAEACSPDPCWGVDQWSSLEPVNAAAIPIDGVLLLRGEQSGNSPDADWLASIDLTVTRDGQPVAGALETSFVDDLLVWRPAAPLEPGATYQVTGTLTNPDDDPYYEYCAPDVLMLGFEFHADMGPAAPLLPPKTGAEESVQLTPQDDLDDLVCCDGAMPYETYFDCGGYESYVMWNEGFCTALHGFGTLRVQVSVDSGLPASTEAMVVRELLVDGQAAGKNFGGTLPASGSAPFCTAVRLTNLATGATVLSEETCHGAAVADQLGDQSIDPTAALGEMCMTGAYVCLVDLEQSKWDETQCSAWPGGEDTTGGSTGGPGTSDGPTSDGPTSGGPGTDGPGTGEGTSSGGTDSGGQDDLVDHGCACDSAGTSPLGLLGLIGLGLLRPRRRARGKPPRS